jgi:NADPH2:quinone reductase
VIEVSVAAIDFVQTQLRRGFTPGPPLPELPYVPGASVAGRVAEVGESVDRGWIGRRVVARTASGWGGNAEKAVAVVETLVEVPPELGLPEAAALLDDGSTALGLMEGVGVRAGDWVLVEAAAGGVGSLLVQLARTAGARVVGAARGLSKLAAVKEVGADVVVDYSEPGWQNRVVEATGGRQPDVVFDGVGGQIGQEAFEVTAAGGRFSIHGASSGSATVIDAARAAQRQIRVLGLEQLHHFGDGAKQRLERVLAEAAAGRLTPVIGQTFPLEEAALAHTAMENRTALGKTLLLI